MYAKILNPIRPDIYLFRCSMCLGFWTGICLWSVGGLTSLYSFDYSLITGLNLGFLSSGVNYVLDRLFSDDGPTFRVLLKNPDNG